jgi:hypothetical protein
MIAAALLAAGILAPAGVTAGIQADPVCLPVTAQPGHSYQLTVYVQGSDPLTLAVAPAHGTLERTLHQVPSSWVHFSSNPASTGQVALTLAVPPYAGPGAYWSDVEAGVEGQAQPGSGGQAVLGAAATTAIVLTVGPSSVPPPPCDALTLAQSTGKFPAWPTKAFATTGWKQVYASDEASERAAQHAPTASPTATTADSGAHVAPSVAYTPTANATPAADSPAGNPSKPRSDWPGWLVAIGLAAAVVAWRRKRSRS